MLRTFSHNPLTKSEVLHLPTQQLEEKTQVILFFFSDFKHNSTQGDKVACRGQETFLAS